MDSESINCDEVKLKPLKCELSYLSKSDGSAFLSIGDTVVLASVNGPLEVKSQSQNIEKATLEVLFLPKGGRPSVTDRYKENIIRQICETSLLVSLYPRSGIAITIQEIEDSGGLIACSINALCLALLNSGLAMNYLFGAVTCCINDSGKIILDPSKSDLDSSQASMTYVFDSQERSLLTCISNGKFSEHDFHEALEQCRLSSEAVFEFYKDIVKKYAKTLG